MTPFTTPEGPTVYVDLSAVTVVAPLQLQAGPGKAVAALGTNQGAMLVGPGIQVAVRGTAREIAGRVAFAKQGGGAILIDHPAVPGEA